MKLQKSLQQAYWSADTSLPVYEMTTGDLLREAAAKYPARTALVEVAPTGMPSVVDAPSTSRRWTYAELLTDAEKCAQWLLNSFEPGERICIWAPNVPEWVIVQFGAALAGMVVVTANPALRANELKYVLEQSKTSALLYTNNFRGTDMAAIANELRHLVKHTISLSTVASSISNCTSNKALPYVSPRSAAQIQYTSGTTGNPKGALLHHAALVSNAHYVWFRAGVKDSVVVSPLPLFHTAGAVLSCMGAMATGSTYVLPVLFDPEIIFKAIQDERAELLFGVPTMLIAMLQHPNRTNYDLSSVKISISGGAPVPAELLRRVEIAFGCDLLAVYGQTEASPIICQTGPNDTFEQKSNTAGLPLPQVEVRIFSTLVDDTAQCGQEGEIQSRGYQTMLGYFEMPEETSKAVTEDRWLRTGDLGVMDEQGYVRVTGRLKEMIIRGGENIYPAELEARILEHPNVSNAVVFGLADEAWGEVVCAAIQLKDTSVRTDKASFIAHCCQLMAPNKVPSRWFLCTNYPMTGSGKIQKFRLKEMVGTDGLVAIQ